MPERGGTPELLARPDPAKGEGNFFGLDTLPGGGVLVGVTARAGSGNHPHVSALAPGGRELKVVLEGSSAIAGFAGGVLVYPEVKGLTALPFDVERMQPSGPPAVIEPGGTNVGGIGVARNGTIAYVRRSDPNADLFRVTLLNPTGEPTKTIADDLRVPRHPRASPDGKRLAISAGQPNFASVWIYDLAGGAQPVRLTSNGSSEFPVWRHDGTELSLSWRGRSWHLASIPTDGSVLEPKEMLEDQNDPVPQGWAPDGKTLLYQVTDLQTGTDIMELDGKSAKSRPWLQTRSNEREARFSPDGRWVVVRSDQTGRFEVWVRAYDQAGGPTRISSDGGHEPTWSHDG